MVVREFHRLRVAAVEKLCADAVAVTFDVPGELAQRYAFKPGQSLTVRRTRRGRLTTGPGHGAPNPAWIPVGHEAVRRIAARIGGFPGGTVGDIFNIPMTAHILGGATIGADPETGVVDAYHRVFNYPGLHIIDGSAVPANLGVNPSLTITAMAERAIALWPNKGEPDPRPATGYRRLAPIPPHSPAVPAHAPAALRLIPPT